MAYLRKQIRDNVVTALTGLSTTGGRKYGNNMAKLYDTDIHRIVQNEIDDAVLYQEEQHTGFRDTATNYYYGEPFGNEVENQSQVVSRDVADTVGFIMPSLIKFFASSRGFVSAQLRHPEDEDAAKQASEYVNWIVTDQHPGYKIIQTGCTTRSSFDWAWSSSTGVMQNFDGPENYDGLTENQLAMLVNDPKVKILEQEIGHGGYGNNEAEEE